MLIITAISFNPRINDEPRNRLEEFLNGTHPLSPERPKTDLGIPRKTILDQTALGPSNMQDESEDKTPHSNLGSGYNDGSRADDEIGPGNTKSLDPEQDLANPDTQNMLFRNEGNSTNGFMGDTSSEFSPLNFESNKRDKKPSPTDDSLRNLYKTPIRRRRAANTNWLFKAV